jgi:hypothetical protein
LLLKILLLVKFLWSTLFPAGWSTSRGSTQVLLAKQSFCCHDLILHLISIGSKQVLIRLIKLLLRFDSLIRSTLRGSRHSYWSNTVVISVGRVIEAVLNLL